MEAAESPTAFNNTCKGCRLSKKTKCDMHISDDHKVRACTRCARLQMECVPEKRKSSAKARLNVESRALLQEQATGGLADGEPAGSSSEGPMAFLSIPAGQGKLAEEPSLVGNSFAACLQGAGATGASGDKTVVEHLVKMVVEVATNADRTELMSFAMQRAAALGLQLSRVLPGTGGKSCTSGAPSDVTPPAAAMELFNAGAPCYMRILISGGRTWNLANAAFKRDIMDEDEAFETLSPTKILGVLEGTNDRKRLLQLIALALQTKLRPWHAHAGAHGAGASDVGGSARAKAKCAVGSSSRGGGDGGGDGGGGGGGSGSGSGVDGGSGSSGASATSTTFFAERCSKAPIQVRMRAGPKVGELVPHTIRARYSRTGQGGNFMCVAVYPCDGDTTPHLAPGACEGARVGSSGGGSSSGGSASAAAAAGGDGCRPPPAKRQRLAQPSAALSDGASILGGMLASALDDAGLDNGAASGDDAAFALGAFADDDVDDDDDLLLPQDGALSLAEALTFLIE
jgi:uncharacterized membrane protein YgcG